LAQGGGGHREGPSRREPMARLRALLLAGALGAALAGSSQAAPAAADSAGPTHSGPTAPSRTAADGRGSKAQQLLQNEPDSSHGKPKLMDMIAEMRAEKCAGMMKKHDDNFDSYDECWNFMLEVCMPQANLVMDGEPGEGTSGKGYCKMFFNDRKKPKPPPLAAPPAAAPVPVAKHKVACGDTNSADREIRRSVGAPAPARYDQEVERQDRWPYHGQYEAYSNKREVRGGRYDKKMMRELHRSEMDSVEHRYDYLKDEAATWRAPRKPKSAAAPRQGLPAAVLAAVAAAWCHASV